MAALIELRNVSKVYSRGLVDPKATVALANVSLTLQDDKPTIVPPQPPTIKLQGESATGKVMPQKKSFPSTRFASTLTS